VTTVRVVSKELAKNHDVTVCTTSALAHKQDFTDVPTETYRDGYRILFFPRNMKQLGFNISLTMAETIKENLHQFDLIHLHSWRHFQDVLVLLLGTRCGIPYLVQAHGSLPKIMSHQGFKKAYDSTIGRLLLQNATMCVALHKYEACQYRQFGVPETKISIVPNGINLAEFLNLPARGSFKARYGIPQESEIILFLGRLHRIKGIDTLVKAFQRITRIEQESTLVIAGPDDGFADEIRALSRNSGLEEKIRLVGPLYGSDKLAALVDCCMLVLPSRYETFPYVILEAYACSKTVIVSEACRASELVLDGRTGLIVPIDDDAKLADALLHVLVNREGALEMGRAAHSYLQEHFTVEQVVNKLERVYSEMLGQG